MSKYILEQLLGSKIRVKVLRFLFRNELGSFDINQLSKHIQESKGDVTKEVKDLQDLGLIKIKR